MKQYEILKNLIQFNTIDDKENIKIINYLESILKEINFQTEYKSKCLVMSIGKEQKLGFLGHTDTVEYIEGWNTNPFDLVIQNNKLYGLGVCDMKGGIASMLDAMFQIDFSKLSYGIKLYFTFNEEIGFKGIKELVNRKTVFPETMIFGEPTYNETLVGSKGLLEYKLEFVGKKAHSSNPEKGISANKNAIHFLNELMQYYENGIKPYQETKYDIPYTTMNIGILSGGSAPNSIPAKCEATLDFRIANNEHIAMIENKVNELSKMYQCNTTIIEKIPSFLIREKTPSKI